MGNHRFKALGIIFILLLAGCGKFIPRNEYSKTQVAETMVAAFPFPTPYYDDKPTEMPKFSEQILGSQNKWEGSKISYYHAIISFSESLGNKRTEREVVIDDGNVIKSSCLINECSATTFEDVFTIEDLFEVTKGSTLDEFSFPGYFTLEYNDCVQQLTFDEIYGFPKSMNIDCPHIHGEEHSFRVILFEAFK